jgi:hypothetical protein
MKFVNHPNELFVFADSPIIRQLAYHKITPVEDYWGDSLSGRSSRTRIGKECLYAAFRSSTSTAG